VSQTPLRVGIIGAGAIGPSHAHAMQDIPQVELVAVCDRDESRAAAIAGEYSVTPYTDLAQMLEVVDAATLCVPSGLHLEPALQVVQAGRHLLVEKPLEITTQRIDRIIEAAALQPQVKLGGVFQTRYMPVVAQLKPLVAEGLLGEIYSGSAYIKRYRTQDYYDSGGWRGTWKIDGGGCLMNQGIHLVDLLLWFCGDVDQVMALTSSVGRQIEVETQVQALLKFGSGATGVIEATTLAYPELPQYLELYGSRGTLAFTGDKVLRLDLMDPTPEESQARDEILQLGEARAAEKARQRQDAVAGAAVPHVDMGHGPVIEDFVSAILEDRPPMVDGHEARRSVELITAIYESGRNAGQAVTLG
jgi:UDP-N-acetyl-2-amino-2-deoxyglucuronate dehydrogenase